MKPNYSNQRVVLELFYRYRSQWLNPAMVARLVGWPVVRSYVCCMRLCEKGWVQRTDAGRMLLYRISISGVRRLAWLREVTAA